MTAMRTVDEAGRLVLPDAAMRVLGTKPGEQLRADVTPNRIDILPEPPLVTETIIERGVLVLAPTGIAADVAAAVRADRDALAERALRR